MVADVGLGVRPAGRAQEGHAHVALRGRTSHRSPPRGGRRRSRARRGRRSDGRGPRTGRGRGASSSGSGARRRRTASRRSRAGAWTATGKRTFSARRSSCQSIAQWNSRRGDSASRRTVCRMRLRAADRALERRPRRASGSASADLRRTRPAGSRCGSRGGTGRGPRPRRRSGGPRRARGRCRGRPWPRARSPSRRGSAARRRGRGPRAGARSRARTRRRPARRAPRSRPRRTARRRTTAPRRSAGRRPSTTTSRRSTPTVLTTSPTTKRSRIAPAVASTSARSRSARAWTSPIDEPGRMSWKWLSRSVCHAPIELLARPRLIRRRPRAARRRAAPAPRAGSPAWCAPASCTSRGGTRGRARRPPRATAPRRPAGEEGLGVADGRARDVLQVFDARERLEHLRRRPAAAVAPAEDEQAARRQRVVLEVAGRAAQLGDGRLGVVGVGRREVREHRRAVDPDPAEGVVLGRVEPVPRELLREEAVDPGAAHDLRQLAVVAEHVGVPEHARAAAELALEEALAVEELAHERLAGGQVAVRLDPRPADREPLPGGDALADPRPEPGRPVADPRVLLGLRAGEAVVGIALHEPHLGGERPHALAEGLLQRPQPRRVDVRVADGGDLVRPGRVAPLLEQRAEDRAGPQPRRAVLGVPGVAEAVELAQELARATRRRRPARPSAPPGRRGRARAPRPRGRSARARSAPGGTAARTPPPRGAADCSSDHPKSPLQAISTRALSPPPPPRAQ